MLQAVTLFYGQPAEVAVVHEARLGLTELAHQRLFGLKMAGKVVFARIGVAFTHKDAVCGRLRAVPGPLADSA